MSDSSFGGDSAGLPMDSGGGKTGGGSPFGGGQGGQNDLLNALNMDPNSLAGGYGDPLYQAQLATTPTNAPTDPQTGATVSPGAGQPSGQSGGWVSQLVSALNPFSMSGAQARPQQPAAPGQPAPAPGWMQPNQGQMYTQGGDPSSWGGESAAAGSYGTPPPTRQQNAPAAAPVAAAPPPVPLPRPRPAAADAAAAPAAADTTPAADPYYDPGGAFGLGPERAAGGGMPGATYDPSTDPFAAATGMTAPADGGTGNLPTPAGGPPRTFADMILGPSPAQAALPPKDQGKPPAPDVGDPLTTPTTDPSAVVPMETGVSGAERRAGAPSQAPASTTGDTTTPPSAAPTAADGAPGGGQAGQPQINPMRLLTDLLFGGPQRLMQDLQSMMQQSQMPGYGQQADGQQQGGRQQGGAAAPWLAQGQRAPRGTRPQDYPQATPEQARAIQQRQAVPGIDAQGRPRTSQANQPNQPRPVTTQRVTPSSGSPSLPGATPTSATMPSTGSGNLDPFTQAAAGGTQPAASGAATASYTGPDLSSQVRRGSANFMGSPRAQAMGLDMRPGDPRTLTNISLPGGGQLRVNRWAAPHFQGFINELNSMGYRINPHDSYGFANRGIYGSTRRSQHAYGNAIDINSSINQRDPSGRNNLPPNVSQIAAKYGLTWGGDWSPRWRDTMHFEWTGAGYGGNNLARIRNAQASGRQGLVQQVPGEAIASGGEQLANEAYGRRMAQGAYPNFRRSANIEDRRRETPETARAKNLPEQWRPERDPTQVSGPRTEFATGDPNDPMAQALGMGNLWSRAPRRTARQW
ncbi:MAG TPA: M15 family metallopeptidase [Xanthobacteraceae bacterium]|jgi:hypothetical protein